MKKYYVEVQDFSKNFRNGAIIYDNLEEALKDFEKELHDLTNYKYFANKNLTVCVGEAIFDNKEDFEENANYEMNELSCCDVAEYYDMSYDEKQGLIDRLRGNNEN